MKSFHSTSVTPNRALRRLVCAGLATANLTAAEPISASYLYSSPASGPYEGRAEQHQWKLQALLPVYAKEGQSPLTLATGGFQYDRLLVEEEVTTDLQLYKIKLGVTGVWRFGDHTVALAVTPGLHSDLKHVDEDDLRIEASAVWTRTVSARVSWVLGFAYEDQFGRPSLFPLGGLRWKPADAWEADLLFPSPRMRFLPTERVALFVAGEPVGSAWNISRTQEPAIDVRQSGYRVGAGIEGSPWSSLWLSIFVGREFNRSYSIGERRGDDIQTWDVDDQDFIRLGLSWR